MLRKESNNKAIFDSKNKNRPMNSGLLNGVGDSGSATMRQRFGLSLLYMYLVSPIAIQAAMGGWRDLRDLVFLFNVVVSISWISLEVPRRCRP